MLGGIIRRIQRAYYSRIKHLDDSDITILKMRRIGINVGNNCRIFTNHFEGHAEPYLIKIGDNVTISSGVHFCNHDNSVIKYLPDKTDLVGCIEIGNNCFIGMNSIIMYGVTLGDGSIVGAGSVVTHSFPANTVIAGNPARAISTVEKQAEKNRKYAINFREIPAGKHEQYLKDHPELLVKK